MGPVGCGLGPAWLGLVLALSKEWDLENSEVSKRFGLHPIHYFTRGEASAVEWCHCALGVGRVCSNV